MRSGRALGVATAFDIAATLDIAAAFDVSTTLDVATAVTTAELDVTATGLQFHVAAAVRLEPAVQCFLGGVGFFFELIRHCGLPPESMLRFCSAPRIASIAVRTVTLCLFLPNSRKDHNPTGALLSQSSLPYGDAAASTVTLV
jgi:hypothetical protein